MSETPVATDAARDFLGREIQVGNLITYPVRKGSSMWLNKLKVTQVRNTGGVFSLVGYNPDDTFKRNVPIRNLHTVTVVPEA